MAEIKRQSLGQALANITNALVSRKFWENMGNIRDRKQVKVYNLKMTISRIHPRTKAYYSDHVEQEGVFNQSIEGLRASQVVELGSKIHEQIDEEKSKGSRSAFDKAFGLQ